MCRWRKTWKLMHQLYFTTCWKWCDRYYVHVTAQNYRTVMLLAMNNYMLLNLSFTSHHENINVFFLCLHLIVQSFAECQLLQRAKLQKSSLVLNKKYTSKITILFTQYSLVATVYLTTAYGHMSRRRQRSVWITITTASINIYGHIFYWPTVFVTTWTP